MELSQAARRILVRHALLIVLFLLAGTALPIYLHLDEERTFTASVRLTLDVPDPKSASESTAIADTARAIVTSPGRLEDAIDDVRIQTGADNFSSENVEVRALGTSGVLQLSVTTQTPGSAAAVANTLAEDLISTRLQVTQGRVADAETSLNDQIDRTLEQMAELDQQIKSERSPSVLTELRERKLHLAQQASLLEQERADLIAAQALRPEPAVVDEASAPAKPDSSTRVTDLALGILLALVAGIATAAVIECLAPTVVGAQAVAITLGAPHLGTLKEGSFDETSPELHDIARRLRLAAAARSIATVGLVSIGKTPDLDTLSEDLSIANLRLVHPYLQQVGLTQNTQSRSGRQQMQAAEEPSQSASLWVQPLESLDEFGLGDKAMTGLVAVAPTAMRIGATKALSDVLQIGDFNLLGVITYRARPFDRFRRLFRRTGDPARRSPSTWIGRHVLKRGSARTPLRDEHSL